MLVTNVFTAIFVGNTDQKAMWATGAAMYILMLTYPLIAAIAGGVIRVAWVRFFDKSSRRINNALMDKADVSIEKPPKWAYRPISFAQSTRSGALVQLLAGLVFGTLGLLMIIYPSPPLEPLSTFTRKLTTFMGYGFLGGFFWYGFRALRLFLSKGEWHIALDDQTLLYHIPAHTKEPSFECSLDDIEKVEVVNRRSADESTSSTASIYLYTKSGQKYDIGNSENRFNPHRLVEALKARGIKIITRNE